MATQKTWTASDLKMNVIKMNLDSNNVLSAVQGYVFVDDQGNVLDALPQRTVDVSSNFSDLPQDIQDALTKINNYMYNEALTQEGMQ